MEWRHATDTFGRHSLILRDILPGRLFRRARVECLTALFKPPLFRILDRISHHVLLLNRMPHLYGCFSVKTPRPA
jgi:hypothetical protein